MGKKSGGRPPPKRKVTLLPKVFDCSMCQATNSIRINIRQGRGTLLCSMCKVKWDCNVTPFMSPVDVFCEWQKAARRDAAQAEEARRTAERRAIATGRTDDEIRRAGRRAADAVFDRVEEQRQAAERAIEVAEEQAAKRRQATRGGTRGARGDRDVGENIQGGAAADARDAALAREEEYEYGSDDDMEATSSQIAREEEEAERAARQDEANADADDVFDSDNADSEGDFSASGSDADATRPKKRQRGKDDRSSKKDKSRADKGKKGGDDNERPAKRSRGAAAPAAASSAFDDADGGDVEAGGDALDNNMEAAAPAPVDSTGGVLAADGAATGAGLLDDEE